MIIENPHPYDNSALKNLWKEAFSDEDGVIDGFFSTAFSSERCFAVREEGGIVGALYWFDCTFSDKRVAYLYAIATSKSHRGRGICRALMQKTEKHLLENGYAGTVLVPGSDELFAFYEKLGYKLCTRIGEIACRAAETPTKLTPVDVEEYADIRRRLLPPLSIIQENENLDFLLTMAELYKGEDFLIAVEKRGKTLHGHEFLGNFSNLGGVVCALGCEMGRFRIPKGEKPFSMCKFFDGGLGEMPSYFGLAFD